MNTTVQHSSKKPNRHELESDRLESFKGFAKSADPKLVESLKQLSIKTRTTPDDSIVVFSYCLLDEMAKRILRFRQAMDSLRDFEDTLY
jgi:hypothetical protein